MRLFAAVSSVFVLCSIAHAAAPGAYSVVEADLSNPRAAPKTSVRCLASDQIDEQGFLIPLKTLASHESCEITSTQANKSDTLEWKAKCAGDTTYDVIERNSSGNFEIDIKVGMFGKTAMAANFKGAALGRECKPGEKSF